MGLFKTPFFNKSPFKQAGKGCAKPEGDGCIRKGSQGYYILNNKKGGIWRDGFSSRAEAQKQIEALHANK